MKHLFRRSGNAFIAECDESVEYIKSIGNGESVEIDIKQPRNLLFFRKWWALVGIAFDYHKDVNRERTTKTGRVIEHNKERFRKDLIVLAGYYAPVFNAKGEVRLEADSISWAKMTEQDFEKLYSATIDAILREVMTNGQWSDQKLRDTVEKIVRF